MKTYQHWINGAHVAPASGQWLDTTDPYQGSVWARIPRGNAADADLAVAAARDAMYNGPWSRMTASERGRILRRIGDLLSDARNAKFLAEVESRDNGKILAEMHGQLMGCSIPYVIGGLDNALHAIAQAARWSSWLRRREASSRRRTPKRARHGTASGWSS